MACVQHGNKYAYQFNLCFIEQLENQNDELGMI